jgi:hypothetical protein
MRIQSFLLVLFVLIMLHAAACSPPEVTDRTNVGITAYRFPLADSKDFSAGVEKLESLGLRTLGLYLGPYYKNLNPQIEENVNTLKGLAAIPHYQQIFEADFDTYVIDCYAFGSGFDIGVKLEKVRYSPGKAYEEITELVRHLHQSYGERGKRFIIKNSRVDLLYDYNSKEEIDKYKGMLKSWFEERISAVKDGSKGARRFAFSAVEFDLVVPSSSFRSVLTEVAPALSPDLFSYNARRLNGQWEQFPLHLKWIQLHIPESEIFGRDNLMIGEVAIISDTPEIEAQSLERFLKQARQNGIPFVLYFSAFGMEKDCYPVFDKDINPTLAWVVVRNSLSESTPEQPARQED